MVIIIPSNQRRSCEGGGGSCAAARVSTAQGQQNGLQNMLNEKKVTLCSKEILYYRPK